MGGVGEGDNYDQNTLHGILKELIFKIAHGGFYISFLKNVTNKCNYIQIGNVCVFRETVYCMSRNEKKISC